MNMDAVITYDINKRHAEIKSEMKKLGYSDKWVIDKKTTYYLPNTTLWKENTTLAKALDDMKSVIAKLNKTNILNPIKLQRCITLSADPWNGIQGDPH